MMKVSEPVIFSNLFVSLRVNPALEIFMTRLSDTRNSLRLRPLS